MNMTLHTPETIYSPRHVPSWLLLSAAAGIVNGFAFLTCQQFVTHVTGTLTRLGLEWWHACVGLGIRGCPDRIFSGRHRSHHQHSNASKFHFSHALGNTASDCGNAP